MSDQDREELRKGSKSGGNDSKEAPATMQKGEKPDTSE